MSVYRYRVVQRGPGDWAVERAWGGGPSWVCFAVTDNRIDAERIIEALALLDDQELIWSESRRGMMGCPECENGNAPHTLAHEGKP